MKPHVPLFKRSTTDLKFRDGMQVERSFQFALRIRGPRGPAIPIRLFQPDAGALFRPSNRASPFGMVKTAGRQGGAVKRTEISQPSQRSPGRLFLLHAGRLRASAR
jgi:hypothetical protein